MGARAQLVMIGHGMVGQRFLESLVERSQEFDITVLCEEPRAAYDRVQLTSFFSGKSADDLSVVPAGFMDRHGITLRIGEKSASCAPPAARRFRTTS
jgi:nitrite reductase (NADH) large subunit